MPSTTLLFDLYLYFCYPVVSPIIHLASYLPIIYDVIEFSKRDTHSFMTSKVLLLSGDVACTHVISLLSRLDCWFRSFSPPSSSFSLPNPQSRATWNIQNIDGLILGWRVLVTFSEGSSILPFRHVWCFLCMEFCETSVPVNYMVTSSPEVWNETHLVTSFHLESGTWFWEIRI